MSAASLGVPKKIGREFVGDAGAPKAAGVVFVAPDGDVLVLLRAATEKNYAGHWSLPGGKADGDETAEQCADREIKEEIGDIPAGKLKLIESRATPNGMVFSTFAKPVEEKFTPELNSEHSGFAWTSLDRLPQPLHPAVAEVLGSNIGVTDDMTPEDWTDLREGFAKWTREEEREPAHASDEAVIDSVGRVHRDKVPISKACINPYKGSEIPNWRELGLEPDRIYKLLRDPEELAKAASTFNGIQVLRDHVAVSDGDHRSNDIVGATGTNAEFEYPYLYNDLSLWAKDAIARVDDKSKKELSSSYAYRADMTPGTFEGEPHDGVMRDIVGNHVATVTKGRAGPDVALDEALIMPGLALDEVKHDPSNGQFSAGGGGSGGSSSAQKTKVSVSALKAKLEGMPHAKLMASLKNPNVDDAVKKHIEKELDSRADRGTSKGFGEDSALSTNPKGNKEIVMSKKTALLSRTAVRLRTALSTLAMDENIKLDEIVKGVTAKNFVARKTSIAKAARLAFDDLGATATGATPDDVIMKVLDMVGTETAAEPAEMDEAPTASTEANAGSPAAAAGGPDMAKIKAWLAAKGMSEDDMSELDGMMGEADDEDETEEEKAARMKKAMDDAGMVTKEAMDAALKVHGNTVAESVLKTQRAIATAAEFVRPWVGSLAMDASINSEADVYRKALGALGVSGAAELHADALKPVLQAQPKPGARPNRERLAMDEAATENLDKRFPHMAARAGA